MKKYIRMALGAMLCTAFGAYAETVAAVTNTFEAAAVGADVSTLASWSGYGNVLAEVPAQPANIGYPASDAAHAQTLSVSGLVTRACSDVTAPAVVDMMVKLQNEDEELVAPTGSVQMALSLDTNGFLNVYHKATAAAAAPQWTKLGGCLTNGTDDSVWVRLGVKFDYAKKMFELRIDGSLCTNAAGWRKTGDTFVAGGGWYYMADTAVTTLASVNVSGLGSVDDVVVGPADLETIPADVTIAGTGAKGSAVNVPYKWFEEQGLPAEPAAAAPGGSGYTLAEAYSAGTDPYDANKLFVSNATFAANQMTLSFNGKAKSYKVQVSASPASGYSEGTAAATTAAGSTWTGDLPNQDVAYFKVTTTDNGADSVNVFGLLRVQSTLTNTIVALPWKALAAANAGSVKVADFVRTTNLKAGDKLLMYGAGGAYTGWTLASDGGAWQAITSVNLGGSLTAGAPSAVELPRGEGVWLVRSNPTDDKGVAIPFYVYGQYEAVTETKSIVASSQNLVASPQTSAFDLNASGKISNPGANDRVLVPSNGLNTVYFRTKNNVWGREVRTYDKVKDTNGFERRKETVSTNETAVVPAGTGFWYMSRGGTPTINW